MSIIYETTAEILEDGKIDLHLKDLPIRAGARFRLKLTSDDASSVPPPVAFNSHGKAVIAGTRLKVMDIIKSHLAYGWSAEELQFQYPFLTMGQVYAALAYYWDHQEALDRQIEFGLAQSDLFRKQQRASPLIARLQAKGLI